MKSFLLSFFYFFAFSFGLIAQYDRPNDFYVTKSGDTTFGTYIYGIKYDGFKNLKGEKIKLKPDSIQSYSIYLENTYHKKNEPDYHDRTWINIRDTMFEVFYRDTGPVSILILQFNRRISLSSDVGIAKYCLERNQVLTGFYPASFYSTAEKYFSDCPTIIDLLDHVPNEKNKEKTHKATIDDAAYIISKYNECMAGKK